ncbi:hypothetical protein LPJ78_003354 [Coemansia sp. RSA 989]|nr:major facilitator superfamily domain-containing protein [Coemansia mojavensis]KAJ1740823.1 hypothetical protein LPJ68_003408 [Coemansia sp. RSA 1086]KAJ1748286.1 hypothetical protein LPJ79_004638 [Coemansia sp. RSA 1821]KAJ1864477.1 hypothetical protein LPJ78_003354 [Coemansia sp. RSA 989]KAJ1870274.1 hypothetical protein LPJ55_004774 [Coemansia sp. RSA 990]KAJ2648850.1 hypothetical protein IWW40_003650 [Coemansia sp. RSA 1250]KAJ2671459.1 hypothetical protein IWW42_003418 [Coemansia sp. R
MESNEYPSVGAKVSKVEYAELNDIELVATENAASTENQAGLLLSYCRKVDRRILLYITVLCILNQSDRGSIGVAKVVGLEKDLGMVKNDFNIASTLFTVGYLSLEFFSNFVLKWIGASRLLPTLGILWGLVCAMQGVINTKAQLYAMRVLLGMSECGFTAGSLLILSFYYPKSKMTSRISLFYLSSPLANVLSGPLASALSQIHHPTIKRWQWVFLLEGIMTIVVSIVGYFVLQDHPEKCRFLKPDEREFIRKYKQKEGTLGGSQKLNFAQVIHVLKDWQLWVMMLGTFAACEACGSVSVFAPEVINELGFTAAQAQAMSALPSVCGAIAMVLVGRIVRLCGSHWLAGFISLGVALAGSVLMVVTLNVPARIVGLCMTGAGGFAGLGIFPGWNVTANSKSVAMSAVASGLTVFFGSSSSFVLSNVFLNSDAPRFVIGHTVNIGIFALGMVSCAITRISMGQRNHKQQYKFEDAFLYEY